MTENRVITDVSFDIHPNDVLEGMKLKRVNPSLEKIVRDLVGRVHPVASPKILYRPSYVESRDEEIIAIDEVEFTSKVLRMNLEKAGRVFPYVITVGREVESVRAPKTDFMAVFCIDAIKELILEQAISYFERHMGERYALGPMAHMNPGSLSEWPIEQQREVFRLLGNVEELIGVRLTESLLMDPVKSVSGIYFPTEVDFKSCMLCTRHPCSKRRAPYDPDMARRYRQGKSVT